MSLTLKRTVWMKMAPTDYMPYQFKKYNYQLDMDNGFILTLVSFK